jgi:hypothetical protein
MICRNKKLLMYKKVLVGVVGSNCGLPDFNRDAINESILKLVREFNSTFPVLISRLIAFLFYPQSTRNKQPHPLARSKTFM